MKFISKVILLPVFLFFINFFANAQNNELFNLLNWNIPQQQSQLLVWYDMQDVKTIKLSNKSTGQVYNINDKGILGNHISQPDKKCQPLLTSNSQFVNGTKNGISFGNGGYMKYKFPTTNELSEITSFVVCKNDLGGSRLLYDLGLEFGEGVASCYSGLYQIESRVPNTLASFTPNFDNNTNEYLILSTRGGKGNVESFLNNEKYSGAGNRNFVGSSYNQLRLSTKLGEAPSNGVLYELILFDKKLTEEEFYKVKNYLENKYIFDETFLARKQQNSPQGSKDITENPSTSSSRQQSSNIIIPEFDNNIDSITIGEQIWMTKNLDVINFQNGDPITQALNKEDWIRLLIEGKPAWCYFNFVDKQYGKIYNFHAIIDKRGLSPKGWKIPNKDEIEILTGFLGDYIGSPKSVNFESLVAQNAIIDNSFSSLVVKGTNKLGFNLNTSALVVYNQESIEKVEFQPSVTFWTFLKPSIKAVNTYFRNSSNGVRVITNFGVNMNSIGCPVRCIKSIEGLFDEQFTDGRVSSKGKWGLINKKGDILIPLIYDEIQEKFDQFSRGGGWFKSGGYYAVRLKNKWGIVNKKGELIVQLLYDEIGKIETRNIDRFPEASIQKHFFPVKLDQKWGLIDENGIIMIKPLFEVLKFRTNSSGLSIYVIKNGITKLYDNPSLLNESDFIVQAPVKNDGAVTKNNNSSVEYDFSELKSQGCDEIKSEFKQFAIKYIAYRKRVKSNPYSLRLREDADWENNLRKFSDLVTTCALKLKGNYMSEVYGYMEKISSLVPIEPVVASSSKNNSTTSPGKSKSTQTNSNAAKKVDQSAGFENTQSNTLIGNCRFTGPQPGKGMSLSIGSDVQLYHNGSFRITSTGGGIDYYTGDGDIWVIYKNPKAKTRYNFKTSNGKVQSCDSY